MMKPLTSAFLLLVTLGSAAAQAPEQLPQPIVQAPTHAAAQSSTIRDIAVAKGIPRPEGFAFGVGLGYQFPSKTGLGQISTSLESPNVTSVRLRFASGLTLEPQLRLAMLVNNYGGSTGMDDSATATALGMATVVRLPLIKRGKVDFEGIGSVGIERVTLKLISAMDPHPATTASLGWGVGVSYWFTPHWNLSLTATNPLASYSTMSPNSSSTKLGVIFDPQVSAMIHLFN